MESAPEARARLQRLRHDLRTSLNHIIGYTEILQDDAPPEMKGDLLRIHVAATKLLKGLQDMGGIVEGLLAMDSAIGSPAISDVPVSRDLAAEQGAAFALLADAPVLVVDDNQENRDLLARRLERCGLAVETAGDGAQALRAIDERPCSLVLLDVMMPGMSGIEVLERIRQGRSMADLPVIMVTSRDSSEDVVVALERGANDYVTKPLNLPVVIARTRTQLELRRATQRIREMAQRLEARNRFIRQTFGRYLTDEVVDSLLRTPEGLNLGGEKRTVTVLMSDLRGFSAISESLTPDQVVILLNNYLARMTEIVLRHEGTIDEFIGDAILVIFGAPTARPDDARRAVACALEMQLAMEDVNRANAALGLPPVEMGIGINTGEVVVGNIGSERRAKYAAVGRNVNLTARIEGCTVGGQVFISEPTLEAAGPDLRVDACLEVFPKGSRRPMRIYELGGIGGEYGLERPRRETLLVTLPEPVPVRFSILDGVQAPPPAHDAAMIQLSRREALLSCGSPVEPLQTLRLVLVGPDGGALPGDVYAKVLKRDDEARSLLVHMTYVAPEVGELLRTLVDG